MRNEELIGKLLTEDEQAEVRRQGARIVESARMGFPRSPKAHRELLRAWKEELAEAVFAYEFLSKGLTDSVPDREEDVVHNVALQEAAVQAILWREAVEKLSELVEDEYLPEKVEEDPPIRGKGESKEEYRQRLQEYVDGLA